jgi:hypothetical protein
VTGRFAQINQDTFFGAIVRCERHSETAYEVSFYDDGNIILWIAEGGSYLDVTFANAPAPVLGTDYVVRIEVRDQLIETEFSGTQLLPVVSVWVNNVLYIDSWWNEFTTPLTDGLPGLCIGRNGHTSPRISRFEAGPLS